MFANRPHKQKYTCQIQSVPHMADSKPLRIESLTLRNRLKLVPKRLLNPKTKRNIKSWANKLITWFSKTKSHDEVMILDQQIPQKPLNLIAGDWVRVRSKEEIRATLDHWRELKGCGFLDEMSLYHGTTHQVLKPVERFVDERDYKVKASKGIVLLEGVICQGTKLYGRCDRACFFFWREEWLEKVEKPL